MRAVTILGNDRLAVADHPDPEPGTGEVLVRIEAAGLNGADLLQVRGLYPAPPGSPADIPGLEFAGEVVGFGSNVSDFAVGDLVSGEGHVVCGRCRNCMAGRRHLCAHSIGLGVNRPGAFAELVSMPMTNISAASAMTAIAGASITSTPPASMAIPR